MGVTGEQIRREQAESRRRSKLLTSSAPKPHLFGWGGGLEVQGFPLAWAVWTLGERRLAVGIFVLLHLANRLTSRFVDVRATPGGLRVRVQKGLSPFHSTELTLSQPELRYWSSWFGAGFELRGTGSDAVVRYAGRRQVRPLQGVRTVKVPCPFSSSSSRALAQAAPNLVVLVTSIALSWGRPPGIAIGLLCMLELAALVARALSGGSHVGLEGDGARQVASGEDASSPTRVGDR